MSQENITLKINNPESTMDENKLYLEKKITYYQDLVQKTIISVQKYKNLDILGASEINVCIRTLESIFTDLYQIKETLEKKKLTKQLLDKLIENLQKINNEFSSLLKTFGTSSMTDLITVCFGNDYINNIVNDSNKNKFDVIKKYVHPINYKIIPWRNEYKPNKESKKKKIAKNRIVEDFMIVETSDNFDCFDLARTSKNFQTKVYGIKIALQHSELRKTMIICGVVDDVLIKCFNHVYINGRINDILNGKPTDPDFMCESFNRFVNCLTIKELLIYSNDELYNKYMGYINQTNLLKQKTISIIVKEFINNELYTQRSTLIQLLLKENNQEFQYLAYLLYDLLSNDSNGTIDTQEQTLLFDSLPWNIKKYFRDAMKQTIQYTSNLSNFDNNKIPLEQQICLMKANDTIKEKAMIKLKEVKAKSEDSGSKARQYLEGLLRIPFGIYREEPILKVFKETKTDFIKLLNKIHNEYPDFKIPLKNDYSVIEIKNYANILHETYIKELFSQNIDKFNVLFKNQKRNELVSSICYVNAIIKMFNLDTHKLTHSGKKNNYMREQLTMFVNKFNKNKNVMKEINSKLFNDGASNYNLIDTIDTELTTINNNWDFINTTMNSTKDILEDAVHGHKRAKRQVERIIGQWISGEQSGYCFGFEGPPGVGKTSLAKKGLANCLYDETVENENDRNRPFSFIAIGGSSNGSTLDGHNYTYVGSTWGKVVDTLMDKKCMNPIIFIDELDKVSRTEQGREIIGILTHLVDPTQNDCFQDKYFNGIEIDLSKALIIFSYNDPELIDRILLDRIHRIKFDHLSLDDKLVITKKYILPEIFQKMGLNNNIIEFSDDIIEFIIEKYTYEPGVRKLKELLFEIIGEINLDLLQKNQEEQQENIPIIVSKDDIKSKYLKERHEIKPKLIHNSPTAGIMNGLWANALGKGGIIPIETNFFPATNFLDLKLTGMQGDVMKESMNVAKTLAWKLTHQKTREKLLKNFEKNKLQGLHIHCPEGAVPKDGPSAGTAITVAMYSLFNNKKIKNTIAITGEINLQGRVTAIGGLELKILGGIRAGVTEFIYPDENQKDYDDIIEKYKDKDYFDNITFHNVTKIEEVLKLVFV